MFNEPVRHPYLPGPSDNEEKKAEKYGGVLGHIFGFVEWVIPLEKYPSDTSHGYAKEAYNEALECISKTVAELKQANKSVKLKFIKNRVAKIARKHAGTLSEDKQRLIVQIATLFK